MTILRLSGGETALVDPEDLDRIVEAGPWGVMRSNPLARDGAGTCYVQTHRGRTTILLHRFIMGLERGACDEDGKRLTVDHLNGDGLDCRKSNMEVVTYAENSRRARREHKVRVSA